VTVDQNVQLANAFRQFGMKSGLPELTLKPVTAATVAAETQYNGTRVSDVEEIRERFASRATLEQFRSFVCNDPCTPSSASKT
jgi:hypothetical protein